MTGADDEAATCECSTGGLAGIPEDEIRRRAVEYTAAAAERLDATVHDAAAAVNVAINVAVEVVVKGAVNVAINVAFNVENVNAAFSTLTSTLKATLKATLKM